MTITDESLIQNLRKGNKVLRNKAVHHLYEICYDPVQYFVVNNSGQSQDAQDIFQEGLLILYKHVIEDRFQAKSTVKTYLFSICKYLWLNKLRSSSIMKLHTLEDQVDKSNEEFTSVDTSSLSVLLSKLHVECQRILRLFYFESMTMEEIKSEFNLGSTQAAKNKKHRCLQHLIKLSSLNKKNLEDFLK